MLNGLRAVRWSLLVAVVAATGVGCELIASVDRSQIQEPVPGGGGSGGAPDAAVLPDVSADVAIDVSVDPCATVTCTECQTCSQGICVDKVAKTPCTPDTSDCTDDVCDANGQCTHPAKPNDCGSRECGASPSGCITACGTCQDGKTCSASQVCVDLCGEVTCGVCQTCSAGTCVDKPNTTPCNDSNACTLTDTCQSGACVGSNLKVCDPPDQCHENGVCNTSTGGCNYPNKAGTPACNDGNACTHGETCQSGICAPASTETCNSPDQCHDAPEAGTGACDHDAGTCNYPAKAGTPACNDSNACTQGETCQSGTCTGGTTVTCPTPDQCHDPGTCDTINGCSNPAKANDTPCDTANLCKSGWTCQAGSCTGGTTVTCTASDQCHDVGTCDPGSGCSNPQKANDTPCDTTNLCKSGWTCQAGSCTGGTTVTCTASDQCHDIGTCDPGSGCSNPAKANDTPCDTADLCKSGWTCQTGTCIGGTTVSCTALDQCHDIGTCNSVNGQCSNPQKANDTPCDTTDLCMLGRTCQAGTCTGGTPVVCDAGTCDSVTGCP